ncbi:MAG: SlyX protein [Pseudomonadales bacterium]|nr:SlyX protein [Pseudomonadales bacterium]
MTQTDQQRIDELEIKTSFQEQLIADLNDELIAHGKRLTDLEQQLQQFIDHMNSLQDKAPDTDEKPPHY